MKTVYICQNCAYSNPKWSGKCPNCETWNSFQPETIQKKTASLGQVKAAAAKSNPISQIKHISARLKTNIAELDQVLSGGIVPGNLILLSGEPGIGKSTLTLQICHNIAIQNLKVLYISGEESVEQISLRAHRLNTISENLNLLNETNLETILATIANEKPDFVIIDSIQVIESQNQTGLPGSISQVRRSTEELMKYAKTHRTPIIIIGHVTKDGHLAGPRILEHLVDTVLFFEGDRYHELRILRNLKNRFGSTNEVGIFEMTELGLKELKNPSVSFLQQQNADTIGSCLSCIIEGSRPLLVEIQALTNKTPFGYPKRTASGYDLNRLQLLIAVLQRHAKIDLSSADVYLNISGGISIKDPATDLAVCLAIASSYKKIPLNHKLVALGELSLTGQIRPSSQAEKRLKENKKFHLETLESKNKHISEILGKIL